MPEYGGCLPLEVPKKSIDLWEGFDSMALNSGRSAIAYAALAGKFSKCCIPYYTCKTVEAGLIEAGVQVSYYNIGQDFMPIEPAGGFDQAALFVYTNYFGVMTKAMAEQIMKEHEHVLFDNTQGFFTEPMKGAYNAYSCRKFFGVPDGAYLVAEEVPYIRLETDKSSATAQFLLTAIEEGPNAAYEASKANEERINNAGMKQMSALTEGLMNGIDLEVVNNRRQMNFNMLHQELKQYNELQPVCENGAPMVYPLLVEAEGLREYMVENQVFVPRWWRWIVESQDTNDFEKHLSKFLIPLPVTQNYTIGDMRAIAKVVKSYSGLKED